MPPITKGSPNNNWLKTPRIHREIDPKNLLVISQFDEGVGVGWSQDGGFVSDDAVNYLTSNKSLVIQATASQFRVSEKTVALDLSTYTHFRFRFKVDDPAKLSAVQFWISSHAFYSNSYLVTTFPHQEAGVWQEITVPKESFGSTGAPNWASIIRVKVKVTPVAGQTVNVTLDEIVGVKSAATKAAIIYTFDDGKASVYSEARRILDKYGRQAVFFVVPTYLNGATFLTDAQVKLLYQAGNEIGFHGYDHTDLSTLTAAEVEAQITRALRYLHNIGVVPGSAMSYPSGGYNDTVLAVVRKYLSFCRSTELFYPDLSLPMTGRHHLSCFNIGYNVTLAAMKAAADLAETNKSIIIYEGHQLVVSPSTGTETAIADFDALVAYCAAKDVDSGVTFNWLSQKYGGC